MTNADGTVVPLWTIATSEATSIPAFTSDEALTPERLAGLRTALAAFASAPLVTLEAHPLSDRSETSSGLPLHAASPLAQELGRLVASTSRSTPDVAPLLNSGEVLYRMVVPAKVAGEFSKGAVKSMTSRAAAGGIYGDLVGDLAGGTAKNVVAKSTFVPVASAGAGGTAVGTVAAGTALTVAAPLVLMAVAVGASALAEQKRQRAIDNITDLLERLHDDALDEERSELEGCLDAIEKATTLLLDRGRVGASLGLDSAVHEINTAISRAERRLKKWEASVEKLAHDEVEPSDLEEAFPGVLADGGQFRAHLELAALAVALKRRVVVLQGVEAGQRDGDNLFENFVNTLKDDQRRVDALDSRLSALVIRMSAFELRSPKRFTGSVMTRRQVEALLDTSYRLRGLSAAYSEQSGASDVLIEIERHEDGTLLVLPSRAV